jgi:hypothetical protein
VVEYVFNTSNIRTTVIEKLYLLSFVKHLNPPLSISLLRQRTLVGACTMVDTTDKTLGHCSHYPSDYS